MSGCRIMVEIIASSRELAVTAFQAKVRELERARFADVSEAGGGGSSGGASMSFSVKVAGPDELPLSEDEIRLLRDLLNKGKS